MGQIYTTSTPSLISHVLSHHITSHHIKSPSLITHYITLYDVCTYLWVVVPDGQLFLSAIEPHVVRCSCGLPSTTPYDLGIGIGRVTTAMTTMTMTKVSIKNNNKGFITTTATLTRVSNSNNNKNG